MKKFIIKNTASQAEKTFLIDYKSELNPQQYEAVTSIKGSYLVIAGAGTGKTRTLIYRMAYMVENGILPQSILLLTFTRRAAYEMMRRASTVLDDRCQKVSGGTFHSFSNSVLRKYGISIGLYPNFTIMDRGDAEDLISVIRNEMELNKKERRFPKKNTLMDIISKAVNKSLPIEEIVFEDYPQYKEDCPDILKVAETYHTLKLQKMILDYDDLLIYLKKLLETSEEARQKICETYKYIMVDEYQDTNNLQAKITQLLGSESRNVMVVGDDSQSIYSFRGASFRNIMDFPKLFPGAQVITLEQNYRSIRPILNLTNAIIQNAKEKYSKNLFSELEGIQKPIYLDMEDESEQSKFIVHQVLSLREEGIPLNKIAVLFRASWHTNDLEIELQKANIPYAKYGGIKFNEAAHIKDVMAYLRIAFNPMDDISWMRILLLLDGIGSTTAKKISEKIIEEGGKISILSDPVFMNKKFGPSLIELGKLISQLSKSKKKPSSLLESLLEYYTPVLRNIYEDYRKRQLDLDSLLRISERYTTMEQMLTEIVLEPPDTAQTGVSPTDSEDEKLVLSTIHSAKGLEWHSVFIIHLVDGFFPSMQSLDDAKDIEEERRLFYVATTRAQQNLYLITPQLQTQSYYWSNYNPSGYSFSEPSRFISEIDNFYDLIEEGVLEYENNDPF